MLTVRADSQKSDAHVTRRDARIAALLHDDLMRPDADAVGGGVEVPFVRAYQKRRPQGVQKQCAERWAVRAVVAMDRIVCRGCSSAAL